MKPDTQTHKKKRALVVGNRVAYMRHARTTLAKAGYQVVTISAFSAALMRMASDRPNIVVLDVCDPHQDVSALLGRLKSNASLADLPVIMMSHKTISCSRVGRRSFSSDR